MAGVLPWWSDWVAYHGALFGMNSEREDTTFDLWHDVFIGLAVTQEEMFAASQTIARRLPIPRFRAEQLQALQEVIHEVRRREVSYVPGKDDDTRGTCVLCYGPGMVVVPHPRAVHFGVWTKRTAEGRPCRTAAVLCNCTLGRWLQANNRRNQMALEEYERLNPHWKDQLAADAQLQQARIRAQTGTQAIDRHLGAPGLSVAADSIAKVLGQRPPAEAGGL